VASTWQWSPPVCTRFRHVRDLVLIESRSFDMMGKRLYKTYTDLTNIVIRVSDGTSAGKEHAVLVNAHLDSTLPSPGAADDALSVGVMLECIRVLTHTPGWTPAHAIVFRKSCISCISLPRLTYRSIQQWRRVVAGLVSPILHAASYSPHVSHTLPSCLPFPQTGLQY